MLSSQIFIAAINRHVSSTNVCFYSDEQHGSKWAISVLQLIFPSLFLAANWQWYIQNVWEILNSQITNVLKQN